MRKHTTVYQPATFGRDGKPQVRGVVRLTERDGLVIAYDGTPEAYEIEPYYLASELRTWAEGGFKVLFTTTGG